MHPSLSIILLATLVNTGSGLTVPPALSINNSNNGTQNLTLGSDLYPNIPPQFRVLYTRIDEPLDLKSCILTAAQAILDMALMNQWTKPLRSIETYSVTPSMRIEIVPVRDDFQRRYAIWGVFYGIVRILQTNAASQQILDVWWDEDDEGQVRFLPNSPKPGLVAGGSGDNSTSSAKRAISSPLPMNHTSIMDTPNVTNSSLEFGNQECHADFKFRTPPSWTLTRAETVIATLSSLVELAAYPSLGSLRAEWFRNYSELDAMLSVRFADGRRGDLNYDCMMQTLVNSLWFCERYMQWGGFDYTIKQYGLKIGYGYLIHMIRL